LIEAKKNTYTGDGELSAPSRPGSKDLSFRQGDYLYIDTYLGNLDFIGEEAVWHQDKPIWSMNYYGVKMADQVPEGFKRCLKGALLKAPVEAPYRGPARYSGAGLEYICSWKGDIELFEGKEQIMENGRVIYRLVFHEGAIRST